MTNIIKVVLVASIAFTAPVAHATEQKAQKLDTQEAFVAEGVSVVIVVAGLAWLGKKAVELGLHVMNEAWMREMKKGCVKQPDGSLICKLPRDKFKTFFKRIENK